MTSRGLKFDEDLLALGARGLSYQQIANELGVTRSVVAGRIKRIKDQALAPVLVRQVGINPLGVKQDYAKRPPPQTHTAKPNRMTIAVRPRGAVNMTKAEMQAMLRRAVENTK